MARPFYDEYAWAYDFIIRQPVSGQCDFITAALSARGVDTGAQVLDAGCGAGGHAIELARRGYAVTAIDLSPRLVIEAQRRAADAGVPVTVVRGNILDLHETIGPRDAILCRGVLNDLLDEASRRKVFHSFSGALRRGGVLVLDVRDWDATVKRKTLEPVFEKSAETPRGRLTFRSVTRLDAERRRLLVSERHTLLRSGVEEVSAYDFSMRCWTREELSERLAEAGFGETEYFGGYDFNTPAGASDRLVCAASKI
jgi:SAM-dependent methyltransferase